MLYYRIKKEYDGARYIVPQGKVGYVREVIADELYTEKEKEKFCLPIGWCEKVNISRKKTYWFFGARFCEE